MKIANTGQYTALQAKNWGMSKPPVFFRYLPGVRDAQMPGLFTSTKKFLDSFHSPVMEIGKALDTMKKDSLIKDFGLYFDVNSERIIMCLECRQQGFIREQVSTALRKLNTAQPEITGALNQINLIEPLLADNAWTVMFEIPRSEMPVIR